MSQQMTLSKMGSTVWKIQPTFLNFVVHSRYSVHVLINFLFPWVTLYIQFCRMYNLIWLWQFPSWFFSFAIKFLFKLHHVVMNQKNFSLGFHVSFWCQVNHCLLFLTVFQSWISETVVADFQDDFLVDREAPVAR